MNVEDARALAYAHLNRRERTVQEVRTHLLRRGVDERIADAVVLELAEQGYLDDRRFASLFIQDKRELSGWGTGRIRRALLSRGVGLEVVQSALEDPAEVNEADPSLSASAHNAELERAVAVLRSRFPDPPETGRDRRRALGVLMRKGYDYELAADALGEYVRQGRDAVGHPVHEAAGPAARH